VVDDTIAQRNALRQSLAAAGARADATGRSVTKARVVAPIDGEIETQIVATGDYVKLGDPLFKLVGVQELRVHLLLPEAAATRIARGCSAVAARRAGAVQGRASTRSSLRWNGQPRARRHRQDQRRGTQFGRRLCERAHRDELTDAALMVPEQSVVLRPAGKVVYALDGNVARQRVVETGRARTNCKSSRVSAGEMVAADGAGFLTDGAAVTVRGARGTDKGTAEKSGKGA
jgi:RND family efflux transporter MFP subunit